MWYGVLGAVNKIKLQVRNDNRRSSEFYVELEIIYKLNMEKMCCVYPYGKFEV